MSNYTPGPWHVSTKPDDGPQALYRGNICILSHNNEEFVRVWVDDEHSFSPAIDTEANARLIAASPAMHKAIKQAIVDLDGISEELDAWSINKVSEYLEAAIEGIDTDTQT